MDSDITKRIEEIRQSQPMEELERKWNKSKGRHSNQFYTQEGLDLADRRAKELSTRLKIE